MSASRLRKKESISDVSCRFMELPDEVIVSILKKSGDPKTLIRCSLVCKHLQYLVSKVETVSLRFSYPGEAGEYLPCWNSHHHIPQLAIPGLMKVFANLKYLEIKLCLCPSLLPFYGARHKHAFAFKLTAEDMNDKMRTDLCMAFEVGSLSSDEEGMLSHEWDRWLSLKMMKNSLLLSFFLVLLCHQPKSLNRVVILSAGIQGRGSEGKLGYKSEDGKVFMDSEQLARFRTLIENTRVKESWLKNPQNLVCWLKKNEENKHRLGEKLWLVHKWEGERCTVNESIVKERDVEKLLGLLPRMTTAMRNNENADFF